MKEIYIRRPGLKDLFSWIINRARVFIVGPTTEEILAQALVKICAEDDSEPSQLSE